MTEPIDKPVEKNSELNSETNAEETIETPTEVTTETPVEPPIVKPMSKPIDGAISVQRVKQIELIGKVFTELSKLGDSTITDRDRLKDVLTDLREMFFMVAIIGEFNAGKSTFVNALLGDELLPMGITPTTEHIELIKYAETAQKVPEIRQDGVRAWAHPDTGAEGVAIVDTPGTGSVFQKHEDIAKSFLHRSDLVIFVISAKRAFADTERLYLELARDYGKKIILVLNQVDLLEPAELQEVRRFIESQVKETLNITPLIFPVSARQELEKHPDSGMPAVKAHLRGVFAESPPARQKLLSQLATLTSILDTQLDAIENRRLLTSTDMSKVTEVRTQLDAQLLGLEKQMKVAGRNIDTVLEGIRQRGTNFIDTHLTVRKIGRGIDQEVLKQEFQDVVIGRALRDINESAGDYINAVVDQSRLYWRDVIDRLNKLQDLMDDDISGMDSNIYAEQRASLQEAIRIAESELKSYSTGTVVADLQSLFKSNLNGFQGTALVSLGGAVTMILAFLTPGPLVGVVGGVAAAPLALPAFVIGATATLVAGVPAIRYLRRISAETKEAFNARIDLLIKNYHTALDDLTRKERNRLNQYGNLILNPILTRLENLTQKHEEQHQIFTQLRDDAKELKQKIESL